MGLLSSVSLVQMERHDSSKSSDLMKLCEKSALEKVWTCCTRLPAPRVVEAIVANATIHLIENRQRELGRNHVLRKVILWV